MYSASHATYYPGTVNMSMKTLFEKGTGKILRAQIIGYDGVDKRIDIIATAIHAGMEYRFLEELYLAYAPPYSSAKDPVNMTGFVIDNVINSKIKQFFQDEVNAIVRDSSATVVDVRIPTKYERRHIEGSVNIPVDEIRDRMGEILRDRPVRLICHSALCSYITGRILTQNGCDCRYLARGIRLYSSVVEDIQTSSFDDSSCGQPSE